MEYLLFKGEFVEIRIIYMIFLSKRRQLKQVFEFLRVLIIYSQAHTDLSTHTHTWQTATHARLIADFSYQNKKQLWHSKFT